MKKIAALSVLLLFALGCASQRVYVKALAEPKWEVEGMRSTAVVPVTVQKTSRLERYTLDLATILNQRLTESLFYTTVKQEEYGAGAFETGPGREHFLTPEESQKLAQSLGVESILTVEVLLANVWIWLGEVPHSFGFGAGSEHVFAHTTFWGRPYCYARARLVVSFDLRRASDGQRVDQVTQTHEFARDFGQLMPSEERVVHTLLERACDTFIPNIDISYVLVPRTFLFDGSKLVRDGVAYAMRRDEGDIDAALQLWQDALEKNPESVAALYDTAVVLELCEQYPEACQKYLQAQAASARPGTFQREISECEHSASVLATFILQKVKSQPPAQEEKKQEPLQEALKESLPPQGEWPEADATALVEVEKHMVEAEKAFQAYMGSKEAGKPDTSVLARGIQEYEQAMAKLEPLRKKYPDDQSLTDMRQDAENKLRALRDDMPEPPQEK